PRDRVRKPVSPNLAEQPINVAHARRGQLRWRHRPGRLVVGSQFRLRQDWPDRNRAVGFCSDASDGQGTLNDTASRRRVRVLAQCKAEKKKMGPNYVRELEGVIYRFKYVDVAASSRHAYSTTAIEPSTDAPLSLLPAATNEESANGSGPVVALLISESPFTRACLLAAQSSTIPFFLLHLPSLDPSPPDDEVFNSIESEPSLESIVPLTTDGAIGTAFWNAALASTRGVLGGEIEMRWERALLESCPVGIGRPGLWWRGRKLASWTPDEILNAL
ncbi:hypothetical protein EW146_g6902, partial [Bondarzewia mesenterica]